MKKLILVLGMVVAALSFATAQEFKLAKNSGRLQIYLGKVTVEGTTGNEIIFTSTDHDHEKDERHHCLRINGGTPCRARGSCSRVLQQHNLFLWHETAAGRCGAKRVSNIRERSNVWAHDYRHGRTHDVVERHLLVVNDEHAGFVFGCGVIVNYLQLYYSEPKPGPVTATRLLARLVSSAFT